MFDVDGGENQHRRFAEFLWFASGCHQVFEILSALSLPVSGFPYWLQQASLLVSKVSMSRIFLVSLHGVLEILEFWQM